MLALNLIKQCRGKLELPTVQTVFGRVVERVHVARDVRRIRLIAAPIASATSKWNGQRNDSEESGGFET